MNNKHDSCVYFFFQNNTNNSSKVYNKKNNIIVNRLVPLNVFLKNEIRVADVIYNIPNYDNYFYIFKKYFKTRISILDEECVYMRQARSIQKPDGKVLLQLAPAPAPLNNKENNLKKLLKTVLLLEKNGLIHNSICEEACIGGLICDFRRTFVEKDDRSMYMRYLVDNDLIRLEMPVEFHIYEYCVKRECLLLSKTNVEEIIDMYIGKLGLLTMFGNRLASEYKENALAYFEEKYVNQNMSEILEEMWKYKGTWDVYGLSLMYLKRFVQIYKLGNNFRKKVTQPFLRLFVTNLNMDPKRRFTLKDTCEKIEEILDGMSVKEYKILF